jgi:hypothetical protein
VTANSVPAVPKTTAAFSLGTEVQMLRAQNEKLNVSVKAQRANVLKAYSLVARLEREARQLAAALQAARAELVEKGIELR